MFLFLKKSVSAADFAKIMWDSCSEWPSKHGGSLKDNFHFEKNIDEVFEEIIYYLGFITDYSFYCQFADKPQTEKSVRDAFCIHLARFAKEHNCKPIPPGEWMGDTLIWMPTGNISTEIGNPLTNLKNRSALYAQSLERRKNKSSGERTAHLLARWCGCPFDAIFILQVMPLFAEQSKMVKTAIDSLRIKS